jgi:hypothetical protein
MMKKTNGRPYADTRLVKYLEKRILELKPRKTQTEIAGQAGFRAANMLAMVKRGSAKLPLDRVPGLAKALDCDPAALFRMALEQLAEDSTALAIGHIFGTIVSRNEADWLNTIREASDNTDPRLTMKAEKAIHAIFGK